MLDQESVAELWIVTVGVEQRVGPKRRNVFGVGDRIGQPAVVGLASELEHPARHRHGNSLGGELFHERVKPFPGRLDCDKYAAARRSTSFSCSSSLIRRRSLAQLRRPAGRRARLGAVIDIGLSYPLRQRDRVHPEISGNLLDRHPGNATAGNPDNIVTELSGIRPCHGVTSSQPTQPGQAISDVTYPCSRPLWAN